MGEMSDWGDNILEVVDRFARGNMDVTVQQQLRFGVRTD
jgi:hypothetical protein